MLLKLSSFLAETSKNFVELSKNNMKIGICWVNSDAVIKGLIFIERITKLKLYGTKVRGESQIKSSMDSSCNQNIEQQSFVLTKNPKGPY